VPKQQIGNAALASGLARLISINSPIESHS
jgi:hypothetical protein